MSDKDEILNQDEVAEICKVKRKTISNWLAGENEAFPKGFKLGDGARAPRRWRRSAIMEFISSREQQAA